MAAARRRGRGGAHPRHPRGDRATTRRPGGLRPRPPARGASVVLAVRDIEKGKRAAARIAGTAPGANVTVQPLDLTSLESIRAAAGELRARHPRIDLLINNAGVMLTPRQTTRDGFELQLGTNHLGHFALTGLLLEQMLPVPGSRVVTVSSLAHRIGARINFDDLQR